MDAAHKSMVKAVETVDAKLKSDDDADEPQEYVDVSDDDEFEI